MNVGRRRWLWNICLNRNYSFLTFAEISPRLQHRLIHVIYLSINYLIRNRFVFPESFTLLGLSIFDIYCLRFTLKFQWALYQSCYFVVEVTAVQNLQTANLKGL
jgi:hypothetical protein